MTPRQELDALLDKFEPQIREAFLAAIADVVDNAVLSEVIKAIEDGDAVRAFQLLGLSPASMRPIVAALETAFETGGVMMGRTFPRLLNTSNGKAVFRFDVRNSRAEAWLRDNSSRLIEKITEDTRVNVANALTIGMQDGRNPRNVALDIVGRIDPGTKRRVGGLVGLTQGQEQWARSAEYKLNDVAGWLARERANHPRADIKPEDHPYFQMGLRDARFDRTVEAAIKAGKPLAVDTVEKLVTRYKDNALKYRGDNIARTEAMQALNRSEYEATLQALDLGAMKASAVQREWDSAGDKRVRWSHRKLNGQRVGIDEPFKSPSGALMLHPGDTSLGAPASEVAMCRCRVRTIIDWLADLGDDIPVKPTLNVAALNKQAKEQVVTNGKRDKVEHMVAFDADTGEKLGATKGSKSGVGFSDTMQQAMETPGRNITAHHNHPSSSSFSPMDIYQVVSLPGLQSLWAHGHNGASFLAEKGTVPINLPTVRQLFEGVGTQMQEEIYAKRMTVADAMQLQNHVASLIYDRRGHIKYKAELKPKTQDAIKRHAAFIERLIERYSNP